MAKYGLQLNFCVVSLVSVNQRGYRASVRRVTSTSLRLRIGTRPGYSCNYTLDSRSLLHSLGDSFIAHRNIVS